MTAIPRVTGPADLERLWGESVPLENHSLPDWLGPEDAWYYRRLRDVPVGELTADERAGLEAVGFVVDPSGVYIPDPTQPVWSIGIYRGPSVAALSPESDQPLLTRESITDVVASYVADPFLLRADGRWHMFFEVYNWLANKGEIGLATSQDGSDWRYEGVVLTEPFHLSYPFVFEWGGERYLIPESHQAEEVRLYRAARFPEDWTFAATLLAGTLVDATLLRFDHLWWLFAGASSERDHDTLHLYCAEDLAGPWTVHPQSPVVAGDPTRARPAGRMLVDGDRTFRFAQDCSELYGASVTSYEITELTRYAYAERRHARAPLLAGTGAGWNGGGMHHIDIQPDAGGGWIAAVDGWSLPEGAHGGGNG